MSNKKPQKRPTEESEVTDPATAETSAARTEEIEKQEPTQPAQQDPTPPSEPVAAPAQQEVPEEVAQLQAVVQKIRARLAWHEEQIKKHRAASDSLLAALQDQLAVLEEPAEVPGEDEPTITARRLILDFIRDKGGEATNQEIKEFFEQQNRRSNPSVELSRMVGEGVLRRPSRGSYALVGKKRK